jgi:hypothetical protein
MSHSHQFAVNHHGVRTSPPSVRGCTLAPPRLTAPPPPLAGEGVAAGQYGSLDGQRHHPQRVSPLPPCTPPPLLGLTATRLAQCRSFHPPPRLPRNRGRRPGVQAGRDSTTWQRHCHQPWTYMGQCCSRWRARQPQASHLQA